MNNSDEEKSLEVQPYYHYEATVVQKIQHFYLSSAIGDAGYYADMINIIRSVTQNDVVYIHLNTPGGNIATGIQIINAMKASLGHVIVAVESEVSSLGTLIFLSADEFIVHDNCLLMFHNYSGGTCGKAHEQHAQLEATMKWFNKLARQTYIPFMSEEEYSRIERGEDIYMMSDEVRDRLENMVKKLEKEKNKKSKPKKKKRTKHK